MSHDAKDIRTIRIYWHIRKLFSEFNNPVVHFVLSVKTRELTFIALCGV